MEDFLNILPIVIFILVVLASSTISAKKKRDRQAEQEEYEEEETEPEVAEQTYAPGFPSSQAESYIPVMEPERHVESQTQSRVRNSAIQSPDLEGVSAIKRTKGSASTEDPYAQHPDVPAAESDWRKAILAHEILKTKF